jgi:hypothetical protein
MGEAVVVGLVVAVAPVVMANTAGDSVTVMTREERQKSTV